MAQNDDALQSELKRSAPWLRPEDRPGAEAGERIRKRAMSLARAIVLSARPHQWAKNALVFVPAILSGDIGRRDVFLTTVLSFAALCLVASAMYIINDVWDVSHDRRHWSKKLRPIASGALPIPTALLIAAIGLALGLLLGFRAGPEAGRIVLGYLALTLAYSFYLKRVPVLDVAVLAGLFTLRLVLGIESADVYASPWLLAFSMFLFSSLCFAKRYVEVQGAANRGIASASGRGYQAEDGPLLFSLGVSTSTSSVVIMVLYVMFDAFQRTFYGNTAWLWAFPLILFLWTSRIWLLAVRGQLDDDPVAFAVRDEVSYVLGLALFAAFLLAWAGIFA
jgi:4-hydroxybenzoate polyprenyltransferase